MADIERDDPHAHTWTIEAVNQDKVNVIVVGEVTVLHTGDGRSHGPEMLLSRLAEGNPVELTHDQLRRLVDVLQTILDGEVHS